VGNQQNSTAARAAGPLPELVGTAAAHHGLPAPHPQRCRRKEMDGDGTSGGGNKETRRLQGRRASKEGASSRARGPWSIAAVEVAPGALAA
jgi:hypothetical protein